MLIIYFLFMHFQLVKNNIFSTNKIIEFCKMKVLNIAVCDINSKLK